jgi:hypothetical protein
MFCVVFQARDEPRPGACGLARPRDSDEFTAGIVEPIVGDLVEGATERVLQDEPAFNDCLNGRVEVETAYLHGLKTQGQAEQDQSETKILISDIELSVSDLQPIFTAIDSIAVHCDVCVGCCSNTRRTARSCTSAGYLPGLPWLHPLNIGASRKPRPVHPIPASLA